eukprot:CAMPEP_0170602618 /NCGR_PEP_ID=MMETSP0224-20130122/18484_1 /TAXON_ID=285029 /ORGANISM="Togula jolla, Strain CCCM 725" /LENGTH=363 /DNA_ID=CAMNT_0010927463 /DNA_START=120 /DNA_END=1211 /DNA_ORIENTATION=-
MDTSLAQEVSNLVQSVTSSSSGLTVTGAFMYIFVAMVVLRLELQRRGGFAVGSMSSGYKESCKRILRQCAPEALGVLACLLLAAALRARGDVHVPDEHVQAWEEIKSQWPLLMSADSLLSLQAMLRLVTLLSVVLRAGSSGPVPFCDEAAALSLGGCLARAVLNCRTTSYALDGPLGGNLPAACEAASIPLLMALSRSAIRRAPMKMALTGAAVAFIACRNQLSLDDNFVSDCLFMSAHCFELLAACTYLVRNLFVDVAGPRGVRVSIGTTHVLMTLQQSLATYYFLRAFDAVPALVATGLPFHVLHFGSALQLGAYAGAAVLFLAEYIEVGGAVEDPAERRPTTWAWQSPQQPELLLSEAVF